ncbi:MAG: TrpB-like pyridoxal phosphate-dependent enzyme [Candidatus Riflebacteria bacterium]|nr:TrpB-like pyridoxal phosphate-dependent enzyme [Candidatus Riflebacteria bacterium]
MTDQENLLGSDGIPRFWYNIVPDLPKPPAASLHPATHKPVVADDLKRLFPEALIAQETSTERLIEIPEEIREIYGLWRPTPLHRAKRLEKALDTPAHIYYKYEGVSPSGSHKPNTAVPQAYYNKQAGIKRLAIESGAGQWGCALAFAARLFGIDVTVYMVKGNSQHKPYRRIAMETWGAKVISSPSEETAAGRAVLALDPESPGSLGIAMSEAAEDASNTADTNYALGSVLNHVVMHQTVIGIEAKEQLKALGESPNIVIACCGGGTNFGGLSFPFLADKLKGKEMRAIAVEPELCPTLTKGEFRYDLGDNAGLTPLLMMYTLGHDFMPPGIHAGGMRYHGVSPLVSHLFNEGLIEARSVQQSAVFEAGVMFARCEGIIPAPESAHAIRTVIDEALRCKEQKTQKTILFCLSGHGHFDMPSYDDYLTGNLHDHELPEEQLHAALSKLPHVEFRW